MPPDDEIHRFNTLVGRPWRHSFAAFRILMKAAALISAVEVQ